MSSGKEMGRTAMPPKGKTKMPGLSTNTGRMAVKQKAKRAASYGKAKGEVALRKMTGNTGKSVSGGKAEKGGKPVMKSRFGLINRMRANAAKKKK